MNDTPRESGAAPERRAARTGLPRTGLLRIGLVCASLVCAVGGIWLGLRPFAAAEFLIFTIAAVAVLHALQLFLGDRDDTPWRRWLLGAAWLAAGLLLFLRPGWGIDLLAPTVGVALILQGIVELAVVVSRRSSSPFTDLLGGVAAILFGVLALVWPDATVMIVAVLFGAVVALTGALHLIRFVEQLVGARSAARRGTADESAEGAGRQRGSRPRWLGPTVRFVAFGAAAALVAVSISAEASRTRVPAFYDWNDPVPSAQGELLRYEETTQGVPDGAKGWRILYSTQDANGTAAVGSALVLVDEQQVAGEHEVLLWDHGTEGIARSCAPSLFADATASMPAPTQALQEGWAIVAPDYVGAGTESPTGYAPYLIGSTEAYSALDSARAALQLTKLDLKNEVMVWGHSQGGGAALWTGKYAKSYAPDLNLVGVAALSPATDLVPLAKSVDGHAAGALVTAYTIVSFATTFDDVDFDQYVRAGAREQTRHAVERCLTDKSLLLSVVEGLGGQGIFAQDLATGPFGDRLRENSATADVGGLPLLVGQGTGDEVISFEITEKWVAEQCEAGYSFDFRSYAGETHMGVIQDAESALPGELVQWTKDRFAGKPLPASARSSCE